MKKGYERIELVRCVAPLDLISDPLCSVREKRLADEFKSGEPEQRGRWRDLLEHHAQGTVLNGARSLLLTKPGGGIIDGAAFIALVAKRLGVIIPIRLALCAVELMHKSSKEIQCKEGGVMRI